MLYDRSTKSQNQSNLRLLGQLKVIKKITLGHVLCATTNIDQVHKDIFKIVNHK